MLEHTTIPSKQEQLAARKKLVEDIRKNNPDCTFSPFLEYEINSAR